MQAMQVVDLIRYYDRDKCQHAPMSESLSPKIVQLMELFGRLPADVDGRTIVATLRDAKPDAAAGTLLRILVQLRAVLRVAHRDGLLDKVPHIAMPAVHDVIDCPISTAEAHLLTAHMRWTAARSWRLTMLLLHTGARLLEALRVKPHDITAAGVRLTKPAAGRTKTISRTIPLTRQLRQAVEEGAFDTPLCAGMPTYREAKMIGGVTRSDLKGACRDLGLPEIRLHDLRHAFAAIVAEQGGDLGDIGTMLGHTDPKTTLRYRGLVSERARRLLENV